MEIIGPIEEDPEYQLIVESNALVSEINNEIQIVHKYIRDRYAKKFPELESLVLNPLDYARVVKRIGNQTVCPLYFYILYIFIFSFKFLFICLSHLLLYSFYYFLIFVCINLN